MSTFLGSKNVFEPDLDPKKSPKGPKSAKRPKIWPNQKQKDRAVLPKQELIVLGSKNVFEPDLDPKNSPIGPKMEKKGPKLARIENKKKGFTY